MYAREKFRHGRHRRYRKPLVSYEFGTRIYAPSEGETCYRIVAKDDDGRRVLQKLPSEDRSASRP